MYKKTGENDWNLSNVILIVDDQTSDFEALEADLHTHPVDYRLLIASNSRQAVEILESRPVDLVVTNLKIAEMDNFKFLTYMSSNFPAIQTIIMSSRGTPENRKLLEQKGYKIFLDKPVRSELLIKTINEGLAEKKEEGVLKGISISSFLQLIEMDNKTCLLDVQGEDPSLCGVFYFNKGDLYDATCGNLIGKEAAIEIIGWENAEIKIKDLPKKKINKRMNSKVMPLILEALSLKDESAQNEQKKDNDKPIQSEEEMKMDVQKLNNAIDLLKGDLGDALLATDIFGAGDGQSIAGHNPQPKASALFCQVSGYLTKSLDQAGFPRLDKFFLLDLKDGKMVVCILLGDFIWAMLVDKSKAQLGLLLNVIMPKIIEAFEEALS